MKIAITTDSSCDLSQKQIEYSKVKIIPYPVILGEKEYLDGVNINSQQIYDYVKENKILPKTAALNSYQYGEFFKEILKEYDAIIHISLSFGISSSGRNAVIAASEIGEDKVKIVDSMSLSSGVALIVLRVYDKIQEGKDLDTIYREIEQEKHKVQCSFMINNLEFLHKGGRCSSLALLGANILSIKPKIGLVDGKMGVPKKYLGKYEVTLKKYFHDTLLDNPPDLSLKRCYVTSSSPMSISAEFKEKLLALGFEEVEICHASSTISAHCGPDTIGILYITK